MSFLVLCPRCRHQVLVQESMAGKPARCPYCAQAFQVPPPPRPVSPPSPKPSAIPPRGAVSAGRPTANPRPQPGAVARKTKPQAQTPRTLPPDTYDISGESPRSRRTLFLGLLSVGIVALLLGGLAGTVIYLGQDPTPTPPRPGSRETLVAQARPRQTDKTVAKPPSKETPGKPADQLDKPTPRKGDAPLEPQPIEPVASRRQAEKPSAPRREEEEPAPLRKDTAKSDAPAKEVTAKPAPTVGAEIPKPAPPAEREPPKLAPSPKEEPPKPGPSANEDVPRRKGVVKVEAPKADPPATEEDPQGNSTHRSEAPRNAKKSSPLLERHKLPRDELVRRLIKSSVFVRTKVGWGSGSLIHKERKLILTNYHVVEGTKEVDASFPLYDKDGELIGDGKVYDKAYDNKEWIHGKVLKRVEGKDLALVQLDTIPERTPALKLAPRAASVGQDVHSIGNAGASDLRWQYSRGSVKQRGDKEWPAQGGMGKVLFFKAKVLETDSPTNPGDSGGPLVDDAMHLVGVTQGANVRARGISYFIDVSEVKQLLKDFGVDPNEVTAESDGAEGGLMETADILQLIKGLEDEDAKVRTRAANRLAELGPQAKRAADPLVHALRKDEEPLVRQSAALALGKLGPESRDVRKEVLKALNDSDSDVRLAVLEALANLGKPEPSELLILLKLLGTSLEKQQYKHSLQIARLLAQLGAKAEAAVPDLREMLKTEDRSVRTAALLALRKIGPAARGAAPELSEALMDTDRDLRLQAAMTLMAIDPSLTGSGKNAVSVLVKALRPASAAEGNSAQANERVQEISSVLVKIGEPAVEPLLRAIRGEFRRGRNRGEDAARDAQARAAVLRIIADLGPAARSTETIKVLVELQRSEPPGPVREAARKAYNAVQDSR